MREVIFSRTRGLNKLSFGISIPSSFLTNKSPSPRVLPKVFSHGIHGALSPADLYSTKLTGGK